MGRETRQARRQRQRRQQQRPQMGTSRWAVLGGSAVIVAVIVLFVALAVKNNSGGAGNGSSASSADIGPPIDGIDCNAMETASYHHHAHLEFYVKGKYILPPPYIGEDIYHSCFYWTHTHSPSYGVVHIEAPHQVTPTLKNFFDIWHQPLSRTRAWRYSARPGESMRVYVNQKLYTGDPRTILLVQHQDITIEFGPPFVKPQPFDYAAHQL